MKLISFIMPAYNEAANLERVIQRIGLVGETLAPDRIEVIVVDDHSLDDTPQVLRAVNQRYPHVRSVRLARRCGSHIAILCGTQVCSGSCAIVLAADGQDPPELAPALIAQWSAGYDVVWCARRNYRRSLLDRLGAGLFYRVMRRISTVSPMSNNADMALLDRKVLRALGAIYERNMNLWCLIDWFGFTQTRILYDKQDRLHGASGWTLMAKVKIALDSLISFSYAPIRFMSFVGILFSAASLGLAGIYFMNWITGGVVFGAYEVPGWATIVCAIFFLGGLQMLMLGVLGEYLWRTFDQVRGRPLYLTEDELAADGLPATIHRSRSAPARQ